MSKALVCILLAICPCIWAQVPMPLDGSRSLEAMQQQEVVLESEALEVTPSLTRWAGHLPFSTCMTKT